MPCVICKYVLFFQFTIMPFNEANGNMQQEARVNKENADDASKKKKVS